MKAVKEIITVPDEILRKHSTEVEKVGKNENLIKNLFDTMLLKGIGLAAIQIVPKRIVVIDVSK